jgi:hypothetical protein
MKGCYTPRQQHIGSPLHSPSCSVGLGACCMEQGLVLSQQVPVGHPRDTGRRLGGTSRCWQQHCLIVLACAPCAAGHGSTKS